MYFDSSIPEGYGVGSSGALVAAVYDYYANNKITVLENLTREKLLKLKDIFSTMESFFHGKSSGLDPLNSYLSIPILINSKKDIKVTGIPSQQRDGEGAVFLLDSGEVSTTAPMINIFMEKMKKDGFRKMLNNQFIKYTNSCVEDFLNGDLSSLFQNTKKLSKVVFDNFKPMIPNKYHSLWQKGIDNDSYFLKLCGSGGGGYILGFTKNIEKAKKELTGHKIEVVYNF
jgi:mevalonate kinase